MSRSSTARRARVSFVLLASMLWPALGLASTSCESAFQEISNPDGATFYMTSSVYPGLDMRAAFERYRRIATDDGYRLLSTPNYNDAVPSLGIARPPSPNPTAIMIDPKSSSIAVTMIVGPGERVDPAAERTRLCGLVAAYDAASGGTPRSAREIADEQQMQARTRLPPPVSSVRVISPRAAFDVHAAKAALEPGHSVIRGQACASYNGQVAFASGEKVLLYPATPYLEEFIRLSKKAKPGREQVVPDPDAIATRMVATANSKGEFQFSQMKPGRYFVLTTISALLGGTHDVYAGRVDGTYGSANVYRSEGYTFGAENELSEFVDVGRDGDVVKVTLQPPISANPFRHGLRGSILGCHELP